VFRVGACAADALAAKGYLRSATPATLAAALAAFPRLGCPLEASLVPYPPTRPEAFAALVDSTLGFAPA
jgi:hypothetical protein